MTRVLGPLAALALLSCAASPERRAIDYLAREVPAWRPKNNCFSCHNNGDAARALYAARKRSMEFDPAALAETEAFLTRPEEWDRNGPPGDFSDKNLAALQFAHAAAAAAAPLDRAAEKVAQLQGPDGSWGVDADGLPGSPVTYGRTLATAVARKILAQAGRARFAAAIGRADAWMLKQRPAGVLDAAATLIGVETLEAADLKRACLEVLRKGQTRDGGWGPYVTSPPEVFDTSIALLALATLRDGRGVDEMIRRGRAFLEAEQNADGSWTETTRPPGAGSYAQRISTTGWAALALLETR